MAIIKMKHKKAGYPNDETLFGFPCYKE